MRAGYPCGREHGVGFYVEGRVGGGGRGGRIRDRWKGVRGDKKREADLMDREHR